MTAGRDLADNWGMCDQERLRWLTRSAAAGTVFLVLTAVVVSPWQDLRPDPGHSGSWLGQAAGALVFGYVGAVVADRTRGRVARVGRLLQLPGLTQAATLATSSYLHRAVHAGWRGVDVVRWLDGWLWVPGVVAVLAVLPLVYPDGRPLPGFSLLTRTGMGLTLVATALVAVEGVPGVGANGAVDVALAAATACCAVGGVAALVLRHRRGDARTREQIHWLAGSVLLVVAFEPLQTLLPRPVAAVGLTVLPLLVPVAVGIAVLRHGLYEIDLLLTRTLAYAVLCTVLAGLYLSVVVLVERRVVGAAVQAPALLAAVTVAVLANPLRTWLQRQVSRWLWGPRAEPHRLLATLTAQLGSSPSVREAPQAVVDTVAAAFRAPYVELLATPADGPPAVVARTGTGDGDPWVVPVEYGGRPVGSLHVGRAESPDPRDEVALRHVASAVGPMLDGWLLTTELQRSRERVVQAREEERLRLHRDLHDGLGPTLGGLTLGLHAARNVVRTDPARAESVLERLSELASEATGEVRVLVDGLRPVALDALGLVGAIRRHTDLGEAGVAVHVHADDVADLPPAVEVAVLRIVLEAVTNVRRHAHASRCEVRLTRDPGGMLTVVVEDDGRGLDGGNGGAAGGVGLESIRARATELGGAVAFGRSPLGGTRILARIPVASTVPAS